jgi:3-hydroxyisobutyrate dehydrogenase
MTRKRIGFIGLGNMGEPMARRLARAGYEIHAFDVSAAAVNRLADVKSVVPHGELVSVAAAAADTIILMLPDSDAVEHVLINDGLLARLAPGTIVIDMSSSEPARTKVLARGAKAQNIHFLDAPVSGGAAAAEQGTLTIMVGGSVELVSAVRPLLEVLGSRVLRAGDIGAGHAVKALNNLMSAAHLLVSSEAILAGQRFGLDPAVMLDIVNTSSGRSGSTQVKWPTFILTGRFDSRFSMRLMLKDMKIALRLVRDTGVPSLLSEAAVEMWSAASEDMPANADHTEIARWLEFKSSILEKGA